MIFQNLWFKKTVVYILAILVYIFVLPAGIQQVLEWFALGWFLMDIIDRTFN